ncbi:MAG: amino acid ABC transporter permease [Pseudomonadota bacterium]|jgi:polar amino acid transport system permease protein|uniref:Polar amino acid transport system permease protein n=1 Tax=Chelatococcus composti TaxID=1743235 RepID=A0A841KH24_9HYPH|nr:polar amino acid transport system permease protein [Chelatococcus composti]PZN40646.1 MAG: ABC transporter permease [Pseudomonadota bacterium]GGG42178.1 ABC transporter permease [Chelatococcus composti]
MTLNFSQLWRYEDLLAQGTLMTLLLTVIAAGAGTLIGVGGAVLVRGGPRPVRWAIRGYIEVIRNTPALIQLFIIFFVLPSLGLRLPPFEAAAVALSIYFGAYAIEIIRAGLDAIPRAQLEAGQCLGLTRWQVFRHIVLLPALRTIYPAFTSQFVLLLLGTSLASQVSAEELFHVGGFIESRTFRSFEVYAVICAIYFALVMAFKLAFAGLERLIFRWPMRR